ncbi:hypothetical protein EFA46_015450 (plasmid) [Halarchaeum sp. CBA1220]|uniref:hypothetical protein n=1 Tax=Halarchaeum sp. CBA1220 TaxID=1853682 RepID=UPI00159FB84F|nr:hypothetical protein [Halarchaeum sp. CBA1220]QLC35654.1 hypothetical protein EFA46_015450 [Halarchaeum sp. CBA1220]
MRGWRTLVALSCVATLVLAPVTIVAADGLGSSIVIPSSNPGVEKTYNNTYRVLASNDADIDLANISYTGYFENDYPFGPVELNAESQSPSQALRYAATQDLYIRQITDYGAIPYKDRWLPYSTRSSTEKTQFLLVHEYNTYDGPKSTDGKWFVRVTNQYGQWQPVYNAEVGWNTDTEEHYVANPDEALIHEAYYGDTIGRSLHVVDQYMAYADQPDRVAVPMVNGHELYPTSDGASLPRKWGQRDFDTVRDSWVGITQVFGSVWYRDSYVSGGSPTRGAYVPYDYRAVTPPDYSYQDQCRIKHSATRTITVNNTTRTVTSSHYHHYDRTKWATYELVDSSAKVTSLRLDRPGFNGHSEWNELIPGTWLAIDGTTSQNYAYPRGRYTLTATLDVTTTVKTRWGITSSRCSEWTKSSTDTSTHTTQYSVPVTITHYDSPNLNLTVAHIDGAGDDRLIIRWDGDQDLPADPWTQLHLDINGKTIDVDSPWRFYGVSRNDEVEVRTASGVSTHDVTYTEDDRWPAIYRYQTSVANVTMGFPQQDVQSQRWGWITPLAGQVATHLVGAPLPDGVNDPENDAPTDLYSQYVATVNSNDLDTGEALRVEGVSTPFGATLDGSQIEAYSKPYTPTILRLTDVNTSSTGDTHSGTLVLTDDSGGVLAGKTLTVIQGDGTKQTVTTNATGRAPITWAGVVVHARYDGDVWETGWGNPYYKGDSLTHLLPPGELTFSAVGTVGAYISAAISNSLIFVEWIALGIFAVWYVRMRRRTSKRRGGKHA